MEKKNDALESIRDLIGNDIAPSSNNLPAFNEIEKLDQADVKDRATKQGKSLVNSVLKLYLSNEMITQNDYVKAKAAIEQATLTTLISQIEKLEHALDVMLNNIDTGEMHPRMFEVYGGLQKTMLDLLKHQTMHMHAMEESTKKLKHDIDLFSNRIEITVSEDTKPEQENINMGNRNLMKSIQDSLKAERKLEEDESQSIDENEE